MDIHVTGKTNKSREVDFVIKVRQLFSIHSQEWWHSGQYFGLPVTRSVVQFQLRTLIYALSSSHMFMLIN